MFGKKYRTRRGEKVRSNPEKLIADLLFTHNIPYNYEKTAYTRGLFGTLFLSKKISKPDFYLPTYDLYIEYWGLVNHSNYSKRAQYIREMKWKMAMYYKNHIRFVSIYPRNLQNLEWILFTKINEHAEVRQTAPIQQPKTVRRALYNRLVIKPYEKHIDTPLHELALRIDPEQEPVRQQKTVRRALYNRLFIKPYTKHVVMPLHKLALRIDPEQESDK